MSFDLTKPCGKCPFRTDIRPFLRSERAEEIISGMQHGGFTCHKTLTHSESGEELIVGKKSQECAGAMILLEKMNSPSQMMRIAERLGLYDRSKLKMDAPIFDTAEEFIDAQE